jgi:hypothetical protein
MWYEQYAVINNNMADSRTFEMEATLATLNVEYWNDEW